ncbi:CsbD family protein [Leucobacter sp. HNU]|uniref:CsbD family protein n=1 Tax=Leucobacter sp. HNU TaxID=3236805 RepID=UPI003A80DF68
MSTENKISAGMDKLKGKAEELVGKATGDDEKVAEGKATQAKGDLKQTAEKAKDAVKDAFDN